MTDGDAAHNHLFLGAGHAQSERKTWLVIGLCTVMMIAEIVGGVIFNSVALVADGLHMSTHAGALLIAAVAYTYARQLAADQRFTFGTGKFGDLAGFTSAIVLAMIALLIGYEAVGRLIDPVPIRFSEAIPIAGLGLLVNLASILLLRGDHHHHHDDDDHDHDHDHDDPLAAPERAAEAGKAHRDNNMRAAFVHVIADAAVSVLVIVGLVLARGFGWVWLDPVAGIIGALVIASWSFGLVRDTGAILLDTNPDRHLAEKVRQVIEIDGDRLVDFHLWRLGPGHLAAILSVDSAIPKSPDVYRVRLDRFAALSHVTIEVRGRA